MSTRRVDGPVQAMGPTGISKSTAGKPCKDIDEPAQTRSVCRWVQASLDRPLAGDRPHPWLDAPCLTQREDGRIVPVAAMIAVAVSSEGKREGAGLHVGPSEAEAFWSTFLKSLARRGLRGVKLVISDAHKASRPRSGA